MSSATIFCPALLELIRLSLVSEDLIGWTTTIWFVNLKLPPVKKVRFSSVNRTFWSLLFSGLDSKDFKFHNNPKYWNK